MRELGVGINTLPHAIKELAGLGLLERLDAVAIRTYELFYTNRFGQEIWREPRGLDAGYDVPQFSIHRGRLQNVIYQAVRARLGESRIHTGHRLGAFQQDESGVTGYFFDRNGAHRTTAHGDVLVGADGIHSAVRETLFPNEGPARWNGSMLWRGAIDWPNFLTGRSMVIAGGMAAKLVIYPIGEGAREDRPLTNWAVLVKVADAGAPPDKEDWSHPGRFEDLMPHVQRFRIPYVDSRALIERLRNSGNFQCAIAIHCRAGRMAGSRCSATRRTPCIRLVRTALRRPSSMRGRWPIAWLPPSIRPTRYGPMSKNGCRPPRRSCA